MAKAILMSIRPKHVCNIFNLIKLLEIRKKFPKDYVGWVYIYCTKQSDLFKSYIRMGYYTTRSTADDLEYNGKGKVVARFWCDKVDLIRVRFNAYCGGELSQDGLCKYACLSLEELDDYLQGENGYAIHITNLEIFDRPKPLQPFFDLDRPPQSWFYIEV